MTHTTRLGNNTANSDVLYMAMELSHSQWRLAFGGGQQRRQRVIAARDMIALEREISQAKEKFKLKNDVETVSCYEAGRDGFWIHRYLASKGIKNYVVDSSSIEVSRKQRRAKTDRLDAEKLLKKLQHYAGGEEKLSIARVPSEEAEDRRRIHREREALKKESIRHKNRMKSLMSLHGIVLRNPARKGWKNFIETSRDWKNEWLPFHQKEELIRIVERLELVERQLKGLEKQMQEELESGKGEVFAKIRGLKNLKGLGDIGAWILIMEWLGWKKFDNRREVGAAAGLVGTPYASGESRREQGISKNGNSRIRTLMIQLSWCWLRYQPQSALSHWFKERFDQGGRSRKRGIVALARKLLIALWRYVTEGQLPEGVELKSKA